MTIIDDTIEIEGMTFQKGKQGKHPCKFRFSRCKWEGILERLEERHRPKSQPLSNVFEIMEFNTFYDMEDQIRQSLGRSPKCSHCNGTGEEPK